MYSDNKTITVSVVLPTYNEKDNIEELINSILNNLKDIPTEIIVVDDNSPDRTWEIVEEMSKENENIKLLRRLKEKGLVSAIRDGISLAKGEKIIKMDADFSMPPNILRDMISYLDDFDIVVGSRYVKGGRDLRDSPLRVFCSRIINLFARWWLNSKTKDLTSGFLVFKKKVIKPQYLSGKYGEYCIGLLYNAQKDGLRIKEFPYNFISRERGQTKTSPNIFTFVQYGVLYILYVLKLRGQNL